MPPAFCWTPKAWAYGLPMDTSRAASRRARPAPPCAWSTTARRWTSISVYPANLGSVHRNPRKSPGCITTYLAAFSMYGPPSTPAVPAKPHCAISAIGQRRIHQCRKRLKHIQFIPRPTVQNPPGTLRYNRRGFSGDEAQADWLRPVGQDKNEDGSRVVVQLENIEPDQDGAIGRMKIDDADNRSQFE